ncbi:MAG TPA: acyl-CoA dehydrogenase family protein [Intrasporangium sp.]|uniref:acyl-CoA dehydrogenase family protein n=1 Tax=Intrasporangium sp. TaxID=1925024 RepID=UPI002D76B050|nr:acyl-CoA dehydrogenase family protein [Intrasporangium sp.]HET7398294.1 acyl-CoA dehydrogenase family protein [Intrasporangium sp.]
MDGETTDRLASCTAPDPDLVRLLEDVFAGYRASRPAPTEIVDFDPALWERLEGLGLTRLSASEPSGGSGATWAEAAALLGAAAAAAAPVPLAEHDVLAAWLLESAGLPNDGRMRTVCRPDPAGHALNVTYGRDAVSVVALWEDGERWRVADVPAERIHVTHERNLAGEASDTLDFDLDDLQAAPYVDDEVGRQFHLRGALARCAQVCGALDRTLELVLAHANAREQFGRPIGRFQAVQALVADIATESSLARAATDTAVTRAAASDWRDPGMLFAVGVAKSCVGHAASLVVRNAHQVLGAVGTTLEHELHLLTKPILVRRSEFGSIHEWDETLTRLAESAGQDGLWPLVTTGRASTR